MDYEDNQEGNVIKGKSVNGRIFLTFISVIKYLHLHTRVLCLCTVMHDLFLMFGFLILIASLRFNSSKK